MRITPFLAFVAGAPLLGALAGPATTAGAASSLAVNHPARQALMVNNLACQPSSGFYCLAPQNIVLSTSPPHCQPFPDGREWQDFTDGNGVHQLWTYSNGGNACIQVNYYPPADSRACYYSFYIPFNGYADAHITFGWWDNNGVKHYANVVDEKPNSGWYQLYMNGGSGVIDKASAINVKKIQFQDNNGDAPGSSVIGWGDSGSFGISELC